MTFKHKKAPIRRLAPSILNADFGVLKDQIAAIEAGGADWVHLDIMDGHFVPNLSFGPVVVEAVRKLTRLPLDCHLMIEHPEKYLGEFAKAGAASITVHQEATVHLDSLVHAIKALGLKAGVSLNPGTPLESLDLLLPEIDLVLLMSVNPGFGGQKFIPYTLDKVRALRDRVTARNLRLDIEVDGGIGPANAKSVLDAGANVIVAGTAVFGSKDIAGACRKLKALMR